MMYLKQLPQCSGTQLAFRRQELVVQKYLFPLDVIFSSFILTAMEVLVWGKGGKPHYAKKKKKKPEKPKGCELFKNCVTFNGWVQAV